MLQKEKNKLSPTSKLRAAHLTLPHWSSDVPASAPATFQCYSSALFSLPHFLFRSRSGRRQVGCQRWCPVVFPEEEQSTNFWRAPQLCRLCLPLLSQAPPPCWPSGWGWLWWQEGGEAWRMHWGTQQNIMLCPLWECHWASPNNLLAENTASVNLKGGPTLASGTQWLPCTWECQRSASLFCPAILHGRRN